MSDFELSGIEIGKRYSITLGNSFCNDKDKSKDSSIFTFHYVFKPASIDKSCPGILTLANSGEVVVEFKSSEKHEQSTDPNQTQSFNIHKLKGTFKKSTGNEYVIHPVKDSIIIEKLSDSVTSLRHERGENITFDPSKIVSDKTISKQLDKKYINPKKKPQPKKKSDASTEKPTAENSTGETPSVIIHNTYSILEESKLPPESVAINSETSSLELQVEIVPSTINPPFNENEVCTENSDISGKRKICDIVENILPGHCRDFVEDSMEALFGED